MGSQATLPGALRTRRLVGREREKAAIREAIEAEGELRILYIVGDGGIGKTRLLEEVPNILAQCKNWDSCRYGGIFDLYLTELQSSSKLEAAIIAALDPEEKGFQAYRARRKEYEKLRKAGGDPKRIEELRQQLEDLFVQGVNEIGSKSRIILYLDTVEIIQYESDEVQKVCEIDLTGIEVKHWLLTNLPKLQNAVVILAGRPKPQLLADFQQTKEFQKHLTTIELGPFTEAETLDYFAAVTEVVPVLQQIGLSTDQQRVIHYYTGGHPIHLALAIELLIRGLRLPAAFFDPLDVAQRKSEADLRRIQESVEEELCAGLMEAGDDVAKVLPFMAFARKGINPELMQRLVMKEWPLGRCRRVLDNLKRFSFVKSRAGTNWLFLHDEMYDLMERHLLRRRRQIPDPASASSTISQYYTEKMDKAKGKVRQDLAVARLYYQLVENPQIGYAQYIRLSDEAVISHEVGFDLRLRDEMLRTFEHYQKDDRWNGLTRKFIDRDSAIRWIRRHVAMADYAGARRIAEKLWAYNHPPFQRTDDDPYFTAALLLYPAEAMAYQNNPRAIEQLNKVIDLLQPVSPAPDDFRGMKEKAYLLGRAYNDLGFIYTRPLRGQEAVVANSQALRQYRTFQKYLEERLGEETRLFDIEWERANTEKNLAYVYGLQGESMDAANLCDESRSRYQRLGQRYGLALALNVRGLLHVFDDQPHRGRMCCRQALRILEDLNDQHGIGMACLGLGRCLRKLGRLDTYAEAPLEAGRAIRFFTDAHKYIQRAQQIFRRLEDPYYLVEATSEMGRVNRDEAQLYRQRGQSDNKIGNKIGKLEKEAVKAINMAMEMAGKHEMLAEKADAYQDLAELYFNQGTPEGYQKAREIAIAIEGDGQEGLIPMRCVITKECGQPECPVATYWLVLGKARLLRGYMAFAAGQCEEAIEHWVLACRYFESYSPTATELKATLQRLYRRLITLSPKRLKELKVWCARVEMDYGKVVTRIQSLFDQAIEKAERQYVE